MMRVFVALLLVILVGVGSAHAASVDFAQQYERGKFLSKQKMFVDAVNALEQAVTLTRRGKTHFGAHIYLAQALWKLGNVSRAKEILSRAKKIIQMNSKLWAVSKIRQRTRLLQRIEGKLDSLFGALRIDPEADPQTVGRIRIQFLPMTPFDDLFKKRVMKFMDNILMRKGIVVTGKTYYLPKGTYQIAVLEPQCLRYALTSGDAVMRRITISSQPVSLSLKEKQSCKCSNGRVLKRTREKRFCVCPSGTVWYDKQKRCKVPRATDNRPWIARHWPWITAVGVAAVATGIIVPVVLIESQTRDREVVLQGKLFTKP